MQEENNCLAHFTTYRRTERHMGNSFEITLVGDDPVQADRNITAAFKEINRIEKLLTTFDEDSQVNQINKNAGRQAVAVDKEVFELVKRSLKISDITSGAFDISYGSLDKRFWNFDTTMTSLPDQAAARHMVRLINYKNIILDNDAQSVFLKEKGMRIGFGGIGKGYAAQQVRNLLKRAGVAAGIVNASGDLATWGKQANGNPWTIGIASPENAHQPFSYINITDMAIATSGNYEKFVMINGKKYSHTINPKTGYPVSGIKSVTIICPDAEIADAMATPVTVLGVKAGMDMINQVKNIGCIIVDDANKIYTSQNVHLK